MGNVTLHATSAATSRQRALQQLLVGLSECVDHSHYAMLNDALRDAQFAGPEEIAQIDAGDLFRCDDQRRRRALAIVRNALRHVLDRLCGGHDETPRFVAQLEPDLSCWIDAACASIRRAVEGRSQHAATRSAAEFVGRFDDRVGSRIADAVKHQSEAADELAQLIETSYSDPTANRLLAIVKSVRASRAAWSIDTEELLSSAVQRLYARIDAYDRKFGAFESWWRRLVDRCLLDLLAQRPPRTNLPSEPEVEVDVTTWAEGDANDVPFSDRDWSTIRGWAEGSVLTPVVVVVGFGWIDKIRACPAHWDEFCGWLEDYGVDDPLEMAEALTPLDREATPRLNTLAQFANRSPNTVRTTFRRSFAGMQQTARQASFGKLHHAVELDYFWELRAFADDSLPGEMVVALQQASVDARVAALCCAPAWPLAGSRENWKRLSGDFPFTRPPPLLELLRRDLAEGADVRLDKTLSSRGEKSNAADVRERILAHATRGNFAAAVERAGMARREGAAFESQLSVLWIEAAKRF
ncbi:MAG: hypothetical protein KDA61_21365 [Planctomycetales bacterium]|nr:hypothetical protein [Planctomycetales bacterium]